MARITRMKKVLSRALSARRLHPREEGSFRSNSLFIRAIRNPRFQLAFSGSAARSSSSAQRSAGEGRGGCCSAATSRRAGLGRLSPRRVRLAAAPGPRAKPGLRTQDPSQFSNRLSSRGLNPNLAKIPRSQRTIRYLPRKAARSLRSRAGLRVISFRLLAAHIRVSIGTSFPWRLRVEG